MPPPGDAVTAALPVSVIMPVLNAADLIGEQLAALSEQTYTGPWELLVVDNGCTDGTIDVVNDWARKIPNLRIVDARKRQSHTFARNAGAEAARGDLLLYCDADDVVYPRWIDAFIEVADGADFMGGLFEDVTLNPPSISGWRKPPPTNRLPTKMRFLPLAISANLAIRARVLAEVGGWNNAYGEGCNDVELSWRVQLAGYKLRFVPDALIAYRYRTTLKGLTRQMYRRGMAEPQLYRDYRPAGVPKRSQWRMAAGIAKLTLQAPQLLQGRAARGQWLNRAATQLGRTVGSIRHRRLYL